MGVRVFLGAGSQSRGCKTGAPVIGVIRLVLLTYLGVSWITGVGGVSVFKWTRVMLGCSSLLKSAHLYGSGSFSE